MTVPRRGTGTGREAPRPLWARWFPGAATIRVYRREWLRPDLVSGLVLTTLLIPQGMAYAELAGLPPATGLYTTVLALVTYAVLGPSNALVLGPDSALAPLIAEVIASLGGVHDPSEAVAFAGVLALLTGAVLVIGGLLRFGAITELISMPVRVGYLNGIAIFVLVSQLPKLAGFSTDAEGTRQQLVAFFEGIGDGLVYAPALFIGLAALAIMLAGRRWMPAFPAMLVAVVGATVVSAIFDMSAEGLPVVGPLPAGFPAPSIPSAPWGDLPTLAGGALAIALISFADTSALSRTFAARRSQTVDPNSEVRALGASNIAVGLFQGFPMSASASRTAVADSLGAKTQLTGLVAAACITGMLLFANGILADLPSATLAAVVIFASFSLFDMVTLRWLARVRRSDFILSVAALVGVLAVGVLQGLVAAIALSVGVFVWRTWRPYAVTLGRVEGRKGYHDTTRHPDARQIPGLVLFRFDAPLFFANAAYFEALVDSLLADHPDVRWIVIAAEPITDVDSTGAESLSRVLDTLDQRGVSLAFAELKGPVKDRLQRYGLYDRIGASRFYSTLGTAINGFLAEEGIEWEDWTDRVD